MHDLVLLYGIFYLRWNSIQSVFFANILNVFFAHFATFSPYVIICGLCSLPYAMFLE
jgi:hypothetical protein